MEVEMGLALLLLFLSLLATVDMAFAQLSDVGLRRLIGENGDKPERRNRAFLRQAFQNRPRFSFALSATIQILLVVVAVLITSISLTLFPDPRWVLVGLLGGLILAGIFRQLIPLFISTRNPEGTLLFLMPVVRFLSHYDVHR
jgi:CBS domain containing-hemolysin-like protein